MDDPSICPICNKPNICKYTHWHDTKDNNSLYYTIDCQFCGLAVISWDFVNRELQTKKIQQYIVSGVTRNVSINNALNQINTLIPIKNYQDLSSFFQIPITPLDKVHTFLLYLYKVQKSFADMISVDTKYDYSIAFATDELEFLYLLKFAYEAGWVEFRSDDPFLKVSSGHFILSDTKLKLSMSGWLKAYDLTEKLPDSKQAFVAIKFEDGELPSYYQFIEKALESCGYKAYNTKDDKHLDSITDVIIAGIRKSGLVVADVTGASQNVYYEAGFAYGLGIPVVLCCKKDSEKDMKFDTSHIKHLLWEDDNDLKNKLATLIEANGLSKK
jgi:nucleoside 2-deoxyribosyltransferase